MFEKLFESARDFINESAPTDEEALIPEEDELEEGKVPESDDSEEETVDKLTEEEE